MSTMHTEMNASNPPILQLRGITKRFGHLVANNNITLDIKQGEVHVFFGENGAGKSTLSNMIYGYKRPDAGKMYLRGEEVSFKSPRDACRHRIGMVHQHFMLVPTLSGLKNILLGLDYGQGPLLDEKRAKERIDELCRQYNVELDLSKEVWKLSVGEQQWIEILKAMFLGSDILILDEPTAVLTPQEADALMDHVLEMKAAGITVIMVSHKLKEIDKVADRISVLRRGELVGTVNAKEISHSELIEMMIGRSYEVDVKKSPASFGKQVLRVEDLVAYNNDKVKVLNGVNLSVREGEIFGIAGVSGNGQTYLYEAITAALPFASGSISIDDKPVSEKVRFKDWHDLRIAEVPEDRIDQGMIGAMTLEENLVFGKHREKEFIRQGTLNWHKISEMSSGKLKEYDVRPADNKYHARSLSGGNMQKMILSRELSKEPRLIVAAQLTRGLDVIAVEFMWKRLLEEREKGAACLLISEDLDELMALSDRIGVMYNGEIVEVFEGEFSAHEIGERMINGRR